MSASGNSSEQQEDDWEAEEELPPLPNDELGSTNEMLERRIYQADDDEQEDDWAGIQEDNSAAADSSYWEDSNLTMTQKVQDDETTQHSTSSSNQGQGNEGEPMVIVDMSILSNSAIHNKFDKMSVNDSKAASDLRRKIESKYDTYAKDALLLTDRAVIPCGTTVWRDALVYLRNETPGHYFAPMFPPNSNSNKKNCATWHLTLNRRNCFEQVDEETPQTHTHQREI
jgi:hypothetical protein